MIILFISEGCSSCRELIKDIPEEWNQKIEILNVEYDQNEKKYKVYKNGIELDGESPVVSIPALCFFDTQEVYSGYSEIMERLTNGSR